MVVEGPLGLRAGDPYVTAITLLLAATLWLKNEYLSHQERRPAEYQKLASLRTSRLIQKVRTEFGQPFVPLKCELADLRRKESDDRRVLSGSRLLAPGDL
jgi:hypothetical protein